MAEILTIISIIAFVIALIAFGFAIFFWVKFHIPSVIGDLSGHTARKSIAKMRANNESANKKQQKVKETRPSRNADETTLLTQNVDETTYLTDNNNETTLLVYDDNETTLLVADNKQNGGGISSNKMVMIEEIMFIHTSEVIVEGD